MEYFLVHSYLPDLTEEMVRLIPAHRERVEHFRKLGKIVTYAVSADRSELWMTLFAPDEEAVMDVLSKLPLIDYLNPEISMLMFQLTPDQIHAPSWN